MIKFTTTYSCGIKLCSHRVSASAMTLAMTLRMGLVIGNTRITLLNISWSSQLVWSRDLIYDIFIIISIKSKVISIYSDQDCFGWEQIFSWILSLFHKISTYNFCLTKSFLKLLTIRMNCTVASYPHLVSDLPPLCGWVSGWRNDSGGAGGMGGGGG